MIATRAVALGLACTLGAAAAAAQGGAQATADAAAQAYPNRAVRIVVPFPAGGPTDILTRVFALPMTILTTSIIFCGAGTHIRVARARRCAFHARR